MRYSLELECAKAWRVCMDSPFCDHMQLWRVKGARLAGMWSSYAFIDLQHYTPLMSIASHAKQCVQALAACAPEHLEDIIHQQDHKLWDHPTCELLPSELIDRTAIHQLLLHPPLPNCPFRHNWLGRVVFLVSQQLTHLQQAVHDLQSALFNCRQAYSTANVEFYHPDAPAPAFHHTGVCWTLHNVYLWAGDQQQIYEVQMHPRLLNQVTAIRRVASMMESQLIHLSHNMEVFIYLEWRALARWRTISIVRHIFDDRSRSLVGYRKNNLSVPEPIVMLVSDMLIGSAPFTHPYYLQLQNPVSICQIRQILSRKRKREQMA